MEAAKKEVLFLMAVSLELNVVNFSPNFKKVMKKVFFP